MLCKLKQNNNIKFIFFILLISLSLIYSAKPIDTIPPATTYTPYIYCRPMQTCTSSDITQANILAFISSSDTSMQIEGLLYYENETRSKIGISNTQIFVRYSCNDGTRNLCKMYSNEEGTFVFNLDYIRSTCSNCTTISFYYCPGENTDLERLSLCLGETIASLPEYCEDQGFFDPSPTILEEYNNYTFATQPVRFCIPSVTGATNQICMGVLIIFGILGAAMFTSGRNPLSFFNFSGPRPPTGRQYRMKPKSVSFTMMVPVGKIIGGISGKIQKSEKKSVDSKTPKVAANVKDIKKGIGKTDLVDKPKTTKAITGAVKSAGFIRQVKLSVQGISSKVAVGVFGEKGANVLFGEGTSETARMATEAMQSMNMRERGIGGVSPQMIAGPPLDYSASFSKDLLTGLFYLGDYWIQGMMNRFTMGIVPYQTITKWKGRLIYGPLSKIGLSLRGYTALNKNEKLFIKELQENWKNIDPKSITISPSKDGKTVIITAKDLNGKTTQLFELRTKNLNTIKYALNSQGTGLNNNSNYAYSLTIEGLFNLITTAVLTQNLQLNKEKINEKLNKIEQKREELEKQKRTATGRELRKIEEQIEELDTNRKGVIWTYSEMNLPEGSELSEYQINEILKEFDSTRENTGTGIIDQKIQKQLDKLTIMTQQAMILYFISRELLPNAYSISTENPNYKKWEEEYKKQKEKNEEKKQELEKEKEELEAKKEFILSGITGLNEEEQKRYSQIEKELEILKNDYKNEEEKLILELNSLTSKMNSTNMEKIHEKILELTERISALKSIYQTEYKNIQEDITRYSNNLIILIGSGTSIYEQFASNGMYSEANEIFNILNEIQTKVQFEFLEEFRSTESIKSDEEIEKLRSTFNKNNYTIELAISAISPLSQTFQADERVLEAIREDESFKTEFNLFIENMTKKLDEYIDTNYDEQINLEKEIQIINEQKQTLLFEAFKLSSYLEPLEEGKEYGIWSSEEQKELQKRLEEIQRKERDLTEEYNKKIEEYESRKEDTQYSILIEGWKIALEANSRYVNETQKPSLTVDTDERMPIATTQYKMYTEYKTMTTEFDKYYSDIESGNLTKEERENTYYRITNTYETTILYRDLFKLNESFIDEYSSWTEKQKEKRSSILESWEKYNEEIKQISSFRNNCEFTRTYSSMITEARDILNTFEETKDEELRKINQKRFDNLISGDLIGFTGAYIHNREYHSVTEEIWNKIKTVFGSTKERETFDSFNKNISSFRKTREDVEEFIISYSYENKEEKNKVDEYLSYYLQDSDKPERQNLDILRNYTAKPENTEYKTLFETTIESRKLFEMFREKAEQQNREAYRQKMYNNDEQTEYHNYNATKYKKYARQLEKSYLTLTKANNEKERKNAIKEYKQLREKLQESIV
ncbi:hypothetical protein KO317_00535 [Candidatus Micrarchaeota archaeon]|nr:hypothetical protein [Candidatus Micrarchaeota archaeon]